MLGTLRRAVPSGCLLHPGSGFDTSAGYLSDAMGPDTSFQEGSLGCVEVQILGLL
jgi:hypothetical protein